MQQYRRFKFVKPFIDHGEVVPAGSELTLMGDRVFFNGGQIMPGLHNLFYNLIMQDGQIMPGLHNLFYNLIMQEIKKPYYLREVPIPYNKV